MPVFLKRRFGGRLLYPACAPQTEPRRGLQTLTFAYIFLSPSFQKRGGAAGLPSRFYFYCCAAKNIYFLWPRPRSYCGSRAIGQKNSLCFTEAIFYCIAARLSMRAPRRAKNKPYNLSRSVFRSRLFFIVEQRAFLSVRRAGQKINIRTLAAAFFVPGYFLLPESAKNA
ncbi:MAG: hypothetical protein Q4G07_02690 [Oscillospiraceae bacterium]|nr:hypothetical protein [Oscillospiraceae bacterium]